MKSPYKHPQYPIVTRKIIGDVGEEDWNRIYLTFPFRGVQDLVIGSLIYAFARAVRASDIPTHYEPTNISRLRVLLEGFTSPCLAGAGHFGLHRRAKEGIRVCLAANEAESADRKVGN